MASKQSSRKLFGLAAFTATATLAHSAASAMTVSLVEPTKDSKGNALTSFGVKLYYDTAPDPTPGGCNYKNVIDIGTETSVYIPDELLQPNTIYYFSAQTYTPDGGRSVCTNPVNGNTGVVDTRVAVASGNQIYIFSVNSNGASPVVQNSVGGFVPFGYSVQGGTASQTVMGESTSRLSIMKPSAGAVMVDELGIDSTIKNGRGSSTIVYNAATTGAPLNDSRPYDSTTGISCRLYSASNGTFSIQQLNQQDFPGTLQSGYYGYPNAGSDSITSNGVTVTKTVQEIRCAAPPTSVPPNSPAIVSSTLVSHVYAGGGDDKAVAVWGFPDGTFGPYSPVVPNSNLAAAISQNYLPAKTKDANGNPYDYLSMAISGSAAAGTLALNVAYVQLTATGTYVLIDQYSGPYTKGANGVTMGYPGYFGGGTIQGKHMPTCSTVIPLPKGAVGIEFNVQGDQIGRLWTQGTQQAGVLNGYNYTLTDTANCNKSAGTFPLPLPPASPSSNPANVVVPANAMLVPGG
jgi:hypothetical protein